MRHVEAILRDLEIEVAITSNEALTMLEGCAFDAVISDNPRTTGLCCLVPAHPREAGLI